MLSVLQLGFKKIFFSTLQQYSTTAIQHYSNTALQHYRSTTLKHHRTTALRVLSIIRLQIFRTAYIRYVLLWVQNHNNDKILEYVLHRDWNLVYSRRMSLTNVFPTPTQSFANSSLINLNLCLIAPDSRE